MPAAPMTRNRTLSEEHGQGARRLACFAKPERNAEVRRRRNRRDGDRHADPGARPSATTEAALTHARPQSIRRVRSHGAGPERLDMIPGTAQVRVVDATRTGSSVVRADVAHNSVDDELDRLAVPAADFSMARVALVGQLAGRTADTSLVWADVMGVAGSNARLVGQYSHSWPSPGSSGRRRLGNRGCVDRFAIWAAQQPDCCAAERESHDDGVVAEPLDLVCACRALLIHALDGYELVAEEGRRLRPDQDVSDPPPVPTPPLRREPVDLAAGDPDDAAEGPWLA